MALLARRQPQQREANRRATPRRVLKLNVRGTTLEGDCASVVIQDISVTGLLLETSADLQLGDRIDVEVPEAGATSATVVWNSGRFFGCKFEQPISTASVSSALLRSPFETPIGESERAAAETTGYAGDAVVNKLSPTARAWVLVALVVAPWALILASLASLLR